MPSRTLTAPLLPLVGADTARPAARRPPGPVREPRRRGQRARAACRRRPGRRRPALVRERPPRRRLPLAGVHLALRGGAALDRDFVDAREDDVAVITRNTTDSINLLASIDAGPRARARRRAPRQPAPVARAASHGATVVASQPTVRGTLERIDDELSAEPYALLAITGASNVTGEALPLDARRRRSRTGTAPASSSTARSCSPTAGSRSPTATSTTSRSPATSSTHRSAPAPSSAAATGSTPEPAYLAGGGAVRQVDLDDVEWAPAPARHEAGSPNVIGAVALATACETLAAVAPGALTDHEDALRVRLLGGLTAIDGVHVLRLWDDTDEPVGRRRLHDRGRRPGAGRRLPRGRARPRRARRPVLRAPRARPPRPRRRRRPRQHRRRHHGGRDRPAAHRRPRVRRARPGERYSVVDGCWTPTDDPRPLPDLAGLAALTATAAPCAPVSE